MVVLNIIHRLDHLSAEFFYMLLSHFAFVEELAEGKAIDIVGYDAHANTRNILEIIDHDNSRMRQIVTDIEFLLYHGPETGIVLILGLESLQHHPFAELLAGVYVVELLPPFGQQLQFGPFFSWGVISHLSLYWLEGQDISCGEIGQLKHRVASAIGAHEIIPRLAVVKIDRQVFGTASGNRNVPLDWHRLPVAILVVTAVGAVAVIVELEFHDIHFRDTHAVDSSKFPVIISQKITGVIIVIIVTG